MEVFVIRSTPLQNLSTAEAVMDSVFLRLKESTAKLSMTSSIADVNKYQSDLKEYIAVKAVYEEAIIAARVTEKSSKEMESLILLIDGTAAISGEMRVPSVSRTDYGVITSAIVVENAADRAFFGRGVSEVSSGRELTLDSRLFPAAEVAKSSENAWWALSLGAKPIQSGCEKFSLYPSPLIMGELSASNLASKELSIVEESDSFHSESNQSSLSIWREYRENFRSSCDTMDSSGHLCLRVLDDLKRAQQIAEHNLSDRDLLRNYQEICNYYELAFQDYYREKLKLDSAMKNYASIYELFKESVSGSDTFDQFSKEFHSDYDSYKKRLELFDTLLQWLNWNKAMGCHIADDAKIVRKQREVQNVYEERARSRERAQKNLW